MVWVYQKGMSISERYKGVDGGGVYPGASEKKLLILKDSFTI